MSARLRQYLIESYFGDKEFITRKVTKNVFIQIDDQDDNDNINQFCNIFVTVRDRGTFDLELLGLIPFTREICDLVEIYNGSVNTTIGHIDIPLTLNQIGVVLDLAGKIKKTANLGSTIKNSNWHRIAPRTVSSLYRFVRIVKEYQNAKIY